MADAGIAYVNIMDMDPDELVAIVDEEFENINFEDLMDVESDDDDVESGYASAQNDDDDEPMDDSDDDDDESMRSDECDQHADSEERIVSVEEINAMNAETIECMVHFYYSTGGALAICTGCITTIPWDDGMGHMYAVRKHESGPRGALDGWGCSMCRADMYVVMPRYMCHDCNQQ